MLLNYRKNSLKQEHETRQHIKNNSRDDTLPLSGNPFHKLDTLNNKWFLVIYSDMNTNNNIYIYIYIYI